MNQNKEITKNRDDKNNIKNESEINENEINENEIKCIEKENITYLRNNENLKNQ